MPSPTEATSRRIAWLTLATESTAMFSGSDRRPTMSVIERATMRISWVRHTIEAIAQMKAIGTPMKRTTFRKRVEERASPPPNRPPVDRA